MKTISKTLLSLTVFSLLSAPALADHHQGKGAGHGGQAGHKTYSAEEIQQHFPMAIERIQEFRMLAMHSLDLIQHAHNLSAQASKDKNLAKALQAAEVFELGHEMHKENMHAMKKMHSHLTRHLGEHQSGKTVLAADLLKQMQEQTQTLGSFIGEHHQTCHVDQKPKNKVMRQQLLSLAHEQFLNAKKSGDTAKMLQAGQLMQALAGGKKEH